MNRREKQKFMGIPGYSGADLETDGGTVKIHNCGSSKIYVTATWKPRRDESRKPNRTAVKG